MFKLIGKRVRASIEFRKNEEIKLEMYSKDNNGLTDNPEVDIIPTIKSLNGYPFGYLLDV